MVVRHSQPHKENATTYTVPVLVCHWLRHGHSTEEVYPFYYPFTHKGEYFELMECLITVALLLYRPWFRNSRGDDPKDTSVSSRCKFFTETNYLGDRNSRRRRPEGTSTSPRAELTQLVTSSLECQIESGHERHPPLNRVVVQESPNPTCLEVRCDSQTGAHTSLSSLLLDHRRPLLCTV